MCRSGLESSATHTYAGKKIDMPKEQSIFPPYQSKEVLIFNSAPALLSASDLPLILNTPHCC